MCIRDRRYPNGSSLEWLHGLVDEPGEEPEEGPTLKQSVKDAWDGKIAVSYFDYDWTLNSQAEPGKAPEGETAAKAGSGGGADE